MGNVHNMGEFYGKVWDRVALKMTKVSDKSCCKDIKKGATESAAPFKTI